MEGYCEYCGQARMVRANTEEEANYIATRNCSCEGAEIEAKVEAAEAALEYVAQSENMCRIEGELLTLIRATIPYIVEGSIDSVSFKLSDSILSIKAGKKIKIKRKRDYTVNMEA